MSQPSSTSAEDRPSEWYVLEHRRGPALDGSESVFDRPEFAEHLAFLGRLQAAGLLVAAGPLPDEEGAGMTVIRSPGTPDAGEVNRLATEDDRCVAAGVLSVRVRPWQVVLSA